MSPTTNYIINLIGDSPDIRKAIKDIIYFRYASDSMVDLIIRYGKVIRLQRDEVVTRHGDFDQWVYIILDGSLDVYLGEQKIDSTSASMVGEKCILGEPRKATLKAQSDGVILLGIDMAIVDALGRDSSDTGEQDKKSCIELLSTITSVVYSRICQLWYYQIGKKKITHKFFQADIIQKTIRALIYNKFTGQKDINDYMDFFLKEHMAADRATFIMADDAINTRKLCLFMQRTNMHRLFDLLVEEISHKFMPKHAVLFEEKYQNIQTVDMGEVIDECFKAVENLVDNKKSLQSEWERLFFKEGEDSFNLYRLTQDLRQLYGLSLKKQLDVVYGVLKIFTEYNDRINKNTGKIYALQSDLPLKELHPETVSDPLTFSVISESLFSSYDDIDQFLIKPYLESLEKKNPDLFKQTPSVVSGDKTVPPTKSADEKDANEPNKKFDQNDIDKLFS